MITKRQFREIIDRCPDGFTVSFIKWSHTENGLCLGRDICGVEEIDRFTRINDIDGKQILVVTFIETFDGISGTKQEFIDNYCGKGDGYINFRLQVDEGNGKTYTVEMIPELGDIGYSDEIATIYFK